MPAAIALLTEMEYTVLRAARRTRRGDAASTLLWHVEIGTNGSSVIPILVPALDDFFGIRLDLSATGETSGATTRDRPGSGISTTPLITVLPVGERVPGGDHRLPDPTDQLLLECNGTPSSLAVATDRLGQLAARGRHDLVDRSTVVVHQESSVRDCTELMAAADWFTENCGHCVLLSPAEPASAVDHNGWTDQPIDRRLAILEIAVRLAVPCPRSEAAGDTTYRPPGAL